MIILRAECLSNRIKLSWFLLCNIVGYKLILKSKKKKKTCQLCHFYVTLVVIKSSFCGLFARILWSCQSHERAGFNKLGNRQEILWTGFTTTVLCLATKKVGQKLVGSKAKFPLPPETCKLWVRCMGDDGRGSKWCAWFA